MRDKSDREFLKELYNGMLHSISTKEEFDSWMVKLEHGHSWQEVLREFTNSVEFHLRVQGIIDSVVGSRQEEAC